MDDTPISPRCWHFAAWPPRDQEAWTRNLQPVSPFRRMANSYQGTRNPESVQKFAKGYGRCLDFLHRRDWLDVDVPPHERLTPARLEAYFVALHEEGCANTTIRGRFRELRAALAILAPGEDTSWIVNANGISINALLPITQRTLFVPDAGVAFAWALEMMQGADKPQSCFVNSLITYRDGLILATLAARARRLRSMTLLRAGYELFEEDGHYRVDLVIGQSKTPKRDQFGFPQVLTPYIRHYLDTVRPALLGGQSHDALWISALSTPLSAKGLQMMVCRRTEARFGVAFGPHRFRHMTSTSIALRDPAHVGIAADVLNISTAVARQHYIRGGQVAAAKNYADLIEHKRREADELKKRRN